MAGLTVATRGFAQEVATPVDGSTPETTGGPGLPEGATLIAEGLWNPRFVRRGQDGTLYITEQGLGGDEVISQPETGVTEAEGSPVPGATPVTEATPEPEGSPSTRGYTGQLSMIAPDGTQTVLVEGLASYSDGVGAHGVALGVGEVYYAVGGMAVQMGLEPLDGENTIFRYVLETGELSEIAELGTFEVENNPDGADVNPNLYMIDHGPEGNLVVADAGGNTIFNVDIASGAFDLAGVVPEVTELGDNVDMSQVMGSGQAVPTSVVVGQDGTVYIAVLREAWPADVPSILTMDDDGMFSPFETDVPLAWTVAMAQGPDGNLYASQLFGEMTEQGPGPGSVVRIGPDGTVEPVVEGVMMPHGLTFDPEGNMFLTINTMMSGPNAPAGMVIRMDGVAPAIG